MKGNRFAGLSLILFGVLYLCMQILDEMNIVLFNFWDLWPLFTLTLGLMFIFAYLKNKQTPGLLIPGGILTAIGLLHLFETITNWYFSAYTWPLYTFALFLGFFIYWLATKETWASVVSFILFMVFCFLTFIVLSMIFDGIITINMAFSFMLILIGLFILLGQRKRRN